jgi:hypothetical protein
LSERTLLRWLARSPLLVLPWAGCVVCFCIPFAHVAAVWSGAVCGSSCNQPTTCLFTKARLRVPNRSVASAVEMQPTDRSDLMRASDGCLCRGCGCGCGCGCDGDGGCGGGGCFRWLVCSQFRRSLVPSVQLCTSLMPTTTASRLVTHSTITPQRRFGHNSSMIRCGALASRYLEGESCGTTSCGMLSFYRLSE